MKLIQVLLIINIIGSIYFINVFGIYQNIHNYNETWET